MVQFYTGLPGSNAHVIVISRSCIQVAERFNHTHYYFRPCVNKLQNELYETRYGAFLFRYICVLTATVLVLFHCIYVVLR